LRRYVSTDLFSPYIHSRCQIVLLYVG